MIVALEGILEKYVVNSVVIKIGPISLNIFVPGSTLSQLGAVGDKVSLHTHLYLKEDNISIYGFTSMEELGLFQNLISRTPPRDRIEPVPQQQSRHRRH